MLQRVDLSLCVVYLFIEVHCVLRVRARINDTMYVQVLGVLEECKTDNTIYFTCFTSPQNITLQ